MPSDAQKARERAESLRRAWDVLQIIRKTIEESQGAPLPTVGTKSITDEGMMIAKHLADHLADPHRDLAFCQKTVDAVWKFKEGVDLRVATHGDRGKVSRMEVKTDNEICDLSRLPHRLAEEIEKRMLFPRREGMRESIQRRRNI